MKFDLQNLKIGTLFLIFFLILLIGAFSVFFSDSKFTDTSGHFEALGTTASYGKFYDNFGLNPLALSGVDGEHDKLYFNVKTANHIALLQVDPYTDEQKQYNSTKGVGAWAFVAGPDKKLYLGTFNDGYLLSFDPLHEDRGIQVIGKPSPTETIIWQLVVGSDGILYGGTYPNGKLITYDPYKQKMADLGPVDPQDKYIRYLAAGDDGWIYLGTGAIKADIKAYNIKTGRVQPTISGLPEKSGFGRVWMGDDRSVYGLIGARYYKLEAGTAREIDYSEVHNVKRTIIDDRFIVVNKTDRGTYTLQDINTNETTLKQFDYIADLNPIDHIYEGPDGIIYGNSNSPPIIFRYNPQTGEFLQFDEPLPTTGTVYSAAKGGPRLYLSAYPHTYLFIFEPGKPWNPGKEPGDNPYRYGQVGQGHNRPLAMTTGTDNRIYIGSVPEYGEAGGGLGIFDPSEMKIVENYYNFIPNQSIVSLASDPVSGYVFGGSNIRTGGGIETDETDSHVFAYDPETRRIIIDYIPLKDHGYIVSLSCKDNKVFAIVNGKGDTGDVYLTVYDIAGKKIVHTNRVDDAFGKLIHNALGIGKDGKIYGLAEKAVFSIDPQTYAIKTVSRSHVTITSGWAITNSGIYFGSKDQLYRWKW